MANLIIKSSADDLVLQGSDASPAITVGATGTTTFAENATMSGVTTLANATITAGTFPSTIFNFPPAYGSLYASSAFSGQGVLDFNTVTSGAGSVPLLNVTHQTAYSSKGGFKVTNAGIYELSFFCMSNNSSSSVLTEIIEMMINNVATREDFYNQHASSTHDQVSGSAIYNLSAGDNLNLQSASTTGYFYGGSYNNFTVKRIG
jgi:hypothetical protein